MKSESTNPVKSGKETKPVAGTAEVAEQVGREILEARLDPAVWATALAQCDGRQQEAMALYTRLRIRQLTKLHRLQRSKNRLFENRRLAKCMGDNETRESLAQAIQEMLHHTRRGHKPQANCFKPRLSVMWLTLLFIGTAGTVASFGRLFSARLPEQLNQPTVVVAVLSGVAAVWGALVLRFFLPKRWIMLGWNTGLVAVCNLVCLSSLFLGTKLIKQAIAADRVVLPFVQEAKPARPPTAARSAATGSRLLVSSETAGSRCAD